MQLHYLLTDVVASDATLKSHRSLSQNEYMASDILSYYISSR